jgi:hypothetical protein
MTTVYQFDAATYKELLQLVMALYIVMPKEISDDFTTVVVKAQEIHKDDDL